MKVLVVLSCAVSLAVAGYDGYQPRYNGPLAVPGPNGVPLETPEVAAVKGAHLSALAAAGGAVPAHASSPYYGGYAAPYAAPIAAAGPLPIDTPEVQQAKAAHFAAFAEAAARNGAPHYRRRRSAAYYGPQHLPVITDRGVPLDTPEVQAAKAYHSQAYADAAARAALSGPGEGEEYQGGKYYGPLHIPVIGPNGVPVDTPEVQAARAAHLNALHSGGSYAPGAAYSAPYAGSYYGSAYPQAQIGPDGQPQETPEVQAAKAAHFAAFSRAYAHAY